MKLKSKSHFNVSKRRITFQRAKERGSVREIQGRDNGSLRLDDSAFEKINNKRENVL